MWKLENVFVGHGIQEGRKLTKTDFISQNVKMPENSKTAKQFATRLHKSLCANSSTGICVFVIQVKDTDKKSLWFEGHSQKSNRKNAGTHEMKPESVSNFKAVIRNHKNRKKNKTSTKKKKTTQKKKTDEKSTTEQEKKKGGGCIIA